LHQCDRSREWTTDELAIVSAIAEHCAVAIHQCQLYQQGQEEHPHRQRVEDVLLENTCDLLQIIHAFPDLYFRLDSDGAVLSYYTGTSSDLYVPSNIFLNKRLQEFLPPDVARQWDEAILKVLNTHLLVTIEYSLLLRGNEKRFSARLLPSSDQQIFVIVQDITERYEADKALRESAERFQKLYEATFEGIAIHIDGKIIDANQALAETSGYAIDELIGMNPFELLALESRELALKHILSGDETPYEAIALRKDGTTFPVEIQGKFINYKGHLFRVAAARNITQRKQAEELVKKQQEFLRQIIDTNPNLIFVKDWNGKFVLVNQALANVYGTTVENLIGNCDADFNTNKEELEHFLRDDREVMTTGIAKIIPEETVTDYKGKVRWYQTIKKPLVAPEETDRQVVCVATDITERKQIELALEKANDELEIKVKERTTQLRNAFAQLQIQVSESQWTETLLAGQKRVLEMIATGATLHNVLDVLAGFIEEQAGHALCSILLLDENKINLRHGAAPSLPDSYNQAVDGLAIGADVGSCGSAAYCKHTVIVSDIASDPKWELFRDLALSHGLRACWSTPIFATNGDVLGTVALYYRTPRPPNLHDRKLVEICTQIAGIAIERKREEEAQRQSEERFRNLVETSSDWVWEVDANAVYIYVSPKIRDLLGYEPEELLGKTPFDLMLPEEASDVAPIFSFIIASQQPFSAFESVNLHKDGSEVVLETSGVPFFDANGKFQGYRGMDRDITERKCAERELRRSENHLRAIIEAEPECVKLVAADGTLLEINPAGIAMFEVESAEALIGSSIYSFIAPEYKKAYQALNENVCQGNKGTLEFEIVGHKGTRRWLESHAVPLLNSSEGNLVKLAIARDITERKRVEQEMLKALEKEKELNELKSRFITITSHEFRTPLSTILSSAELIEHYSHVLSEEKKLKRLHHIQAAVKQMTQLLNDVLIIGKAEAGKLELNPDPLDLNKFCQELVEEMQLIAGNQHTITFASQCDCTPTYMDEKLLRHIFSNLLSNAIKYSPEGGSIHFEVFCQNGEATFLVKDQGIGIPPEDQQRLFESFHRATNVGTISGTGLGLAIVKNCVDLHSGSIIVASEIGEGTTFKVTLPINYSGLLR
ncbi:MAG TPA: PAS domain S-box protein, partial [Candidatus Obscuribacterales bacterium]